MHIVVLLCLAVASCLVQLDVACKQSALQPLMYMVVSWPSLSDYQSLDLRISQIFIDTPSRPEGSVEEGDGEGEGEEGIVKGEREWKEDEEMARLKCLASEYHSANSTSAVLAFSTQHGGPLEASLWGLVEGGWILTSRIETVSACREYRQ